MITFIIAFRRILKLRAHSSLFFSLFSKRRMQQCTEHVKLGPSAHAGELLLTIYVSCELVEMVRYRLQVNRGEYHQRFYLMRSKLTARHQLMC